MDGDISALMEEVKNLRKQCERYIAALDFYADPAHYSDSAKRVITADGSFANVCSVLADGGARARAVPQ